MKFVVAAVALTAMLGSGAALAQTEMDHRVQRAWDDVFSPPPPGDPRTNWERHRDNVEAQRRANWCRYHAGAQGCG